MGHRARECLHKKAFDVGTYKPDTTATTNTTTGGTATAPALASAVSAFTNTTRGALGESRTINNQELAELLRSTQDNGDGTSTLLFVTLSQVLRALLRPCPLHTA